MAKKHEKKPEIQPEEAAVLAPQEAVQVAPNEQPEAQGPREDQAIKQKKVCGIGGCTTWYDDPELMKKHLRRQHGIGAENLNKPKPRNKDIKLA